MPVKIIASNQTIQAWILLRQTCAALAKCEDFLFLRSELTPQQHMVLVALDSLSGVVTPSDVAHWLDRNRNSITQIIDNMERDGFVTRVRDQRDRRKLRLMMTEKGKEALYRARRPSVKMANALMSCLSEDELQTFIRLLDKIRGRAFENVGNTGMVREVRLKYE